MTRTNNLYLIIGALVVAVAALGIYVCMKKASRRVSK